MTIRDFFSFRENKFFWIHIMLMIVAVCLLVFGVLKGIDIYTQHGQSIEVPNVKGMNATEARLFLEKHGLDCEVVDSSYMKHTRAGSVLDQSPIEGSQVKKGRIVYLTINSLKVPMLVVPDVADNSSARQAQARLSAMGFKLTIDEFVSGEKDWVYGIKYNGRQLEAGEKVPTGATLTLLVGDGSREVTIEEDSINAELPVDKATSGETTVDESWF
ncbi:MAG: PASTA domain-containing protein [Bacteroidaceae bacterium]